MPPLAGELIRASDVPADAWTSYTPTLGNWTIGNGTITGSYMRMGDLVVVYIKFTDGSTTTESGTPTFSLPVTAAISATGDCFGVANLFDTSASAVRLGIAAGLNSSTVRLYNAADGAAVSPTVPWTWATGDTIALCLQYEAA